MVDKAPVDDPKHKAPVDDPRNIGTRLLIVVEMLQKAVDDAQRALTQVRSDVIAGGSAKPPEEEASQ